MLFNFRYNAIVAFNIFVGFLNVFLVYRLMGVSAASDVYFIGISLISTVYLLVMMLGDQFSIRFRAVVSDPALARGYLSSFLLFSIIASVFFGGLLFFLQSDLIVFFSGSMDSERSFLARDFLTSLSVSVYLYFPFQVLSMAIGGSGRVGWSFALSGLPALGVSFVLAIHMFLSWSVDSLYLIGVGYSIGTVVAFLLAFWLCLKYVGFSSVLDVENVLATVVESFKIKFSGNVHNVFLNWVIVAFLTRFSPGDASLFFYAKRLADAILSIAYGPTHRLLLNSIVDDFKLRKYSEIKLKLNKVTVIFPVIFLVLFAVIAVFGFLVRDYVEGGVDAFNLFLTSLFFLMCANALISAEVCYGVVNQVKVDYKIVLISNICFVMIVSFFLLVLTDVLGVFSLPVSIFLGQIANFYLNRRRAISYLGVG